MGLLRTLNIMAPTTQTEELRLNKRYAVWNIVYKLRYSNPFTLSIRPAYSLRAYAVDHEGDL